MHAARQAEALSPDALRMAAEIMGAGTPQDLVTAVRSFTPKVKPPAPFPVTATDWAPHRLMSSGLAALMFILGSLPLPRGAPLADSR